VSLWVCNEHGLFGGRAFCPKCGAPGVFAKDASPTPTNDGEGVIERLTEALTVARNRLQAAAINATAAGLKERYEYSEWADEATASLAALNQGGCDQCGKRNGHHPACIYKKSVDR
jgi:hypothetical protein